MKRLLQGRNFEQKGPCNLSSILGLYVIPEMLKLQAYSFNVEFLTFPLLYGSGFA